VYICGMEMTQTIKNEVNGVIAKYILATDIVTEVEATTNKHYNVNQKFEVVRDSKVYFISVKQIDVIGQVIKSHLRLDVDTNLPTPTKPLTKKQVKILELEARLRIAKANNCKHEIYQCRVDLSKLY
jgi:hypothetical protein